MTLAVRIGINPISWSNDDLPSLGGEIPLEVALAEGKAIGYEGFELGNKFPREPKALARVLAAHDLALVSGWYSGRLAQRSVAAEIAAVQPHLRLLAENAGRVMVYGEVADSIQGACVPLYKRPRFRRATDWDRYAQRLDEFARFTLQHGVRLAYHHHMGAYVQAPDDVDELMSRVGEEVGLLFDTGHITFAAAMANPHHPAVEARAQLRGAAIAALEKHAARVCHVHCKDVRPQVLSLARNRQWSFLEAVTNGAFTVPGDGMIDFAGVLRILDAHDYRGWLVVEAEQDPAVAPSYEYAQIGFRHLRTLVDALG